MRKLNPRVDLVFKKIFGIEENSDLLISLINSIVGEEDQVKEVTLLNPYTLDRFKDDKLSILDIKAKSVCGKKFNIEIQITDEADYDKRALYYWAKLYTEQLKVSGDYAELEKVIGIHILNFISIVDCKKYHNAFHVTEKEAGFPYFKNLELHTVELKKFTENAPEVLKELADQVRTSLDMWSAFLTRHELLNSETLPQNLNKPELKKALEVLNVMNFSEVEQEAYESRLKWLRIEANTLKKAEEKGHERGHKKGRKEGREEGLKEGRKKEKIALAKKLLQKGVMSLEEVAEITALTIEDVQSLEHQKLAKIRVLR